jgi:hypothetical protein
MPDALAAPQLFAEDAVVFFRQQYVRGWIAVVQPYAGYLNAAPRLTSLVASFFDPALAPKFYVASAIGLAAWSAGTAASCDELPARGFLLGSALALPPHAGLEVFGTITNIQWVLAPTLALVCMTAKATINTVAFTLVAGLSGPFSTLLLPWAALRTLKQRDSIGYAVVACGLTQLVMLLIFPGRSVEPGVRDIPQLAETMVARAFLTPSATAAFAGGVLVAVSLAVRRGRDLRMSLMLFGTAILAATFVKFVPHGHLLVLPTNGARYFYVPHVILLWCAISLLFTREARAVSVAWLLCMVSIYPSDFLRREPLRRTDWAAEVRDIGKRELRVPINPPGWILTLPPKP